MLQEIKDKFKELYEQEPLVVRSPGRVNLIGEHTDYNDGFVLPAAINKEIYFAVAPNNTNTFRAYAYDLQEGGEFDLGQVQRSEKSWANYLLGVVAQLQQAKYEVKGFDLVYGGNIPIGAGLSSSAAVECGLAYALNHIFGFNIPKFDLVKMAQLAEHEYAGVKCGIMDQFASMYGRQDHAVKLDCRSLDFDYYHLEMADYRIVLCDTQVKHNLASSEYNTRRQECEAGVALLQRHYPQVKSLRDVTVPMLELHQEEFEPTVYRRCTYVVHENIRVEEACQALEQGDMKTFGEKMYASHRGLQHDYGVSCPELDFLVDQAREMDSVLGARMMGGGFGGCTINLVKLEALDAFIQSMEEAYKLQFGIALKTYVAEIVDGSSLVEPSQI
ncbi:galactokinase [Pontibacter flavimaris]|uniref:Galactokinase n=1 Tax=Pontibacter flavimaris TaxID=1797110 RepID=A0A1Q5PIK0_9BACT|nr:galactokinase [Pontibacter flavimaris]OKL42045.1 galactokinase [Pontibacter flavimaris]